MSAYPKGGFATSMPQPRRFPLQPASRTVSSACRILQMPVAATLRSNASIAADSMSGYQSA